RVLFRSGVGEPVGVVHDGDGVARGRLGREDVDLAEGPSGGGHAVTGKISSSSARSSAVGVHVHACAFATTCSGRVAPAITDDTSGRDSSHENAATTSVTPRSRQNAPNRSSASHGAVSSRCGFTSTRRVPSGRAPREYLPVSRPSASGK